MVKAKDLCWKCRFSRYYDELHVECVNEKAHYNHRLNEPKLNDTLQLIEFLEEHGIKVEKKTLRKAWWEGEDK